MKVVAEVEEVRMFAVATVERTLGKVDLNSFLLRVGSHTTVAVPLHEMTVLDILLEAAEAESLGLGHRRREPLHSIRDMGNLVGNVALLLAAMEVVVSADMESEDTRLEEVAVFQHDDSDVASMLCVLCQSKKHISQPSKCLPTTRMGAGVWSFPSMNTPNLVSRTLGNRYLCLASELLSLNDFPHSLHVCGLSPVCTRVCTVSADRWMNSFPHSSHLYGLHNVRRLIKTRYRTVIQNVSVLGDMC